MKKKTYRQLTPEQRHTIQIMRQAGNSQAQIARDQDRAASTISRELNRNASADGVYEHAGAQRQAMQRRPRHLLSSRFGGFQHLDVRGLLELRGDFSHARCVGHGRA